MKTIKLPVKDSLSTRSQDFNPYHIESFFSYEDCVMMKCSSGESYKIALSLKKFRKLIGKKKK